MESDMNIEISGLNEERVSQALARREELLRQRTAEMRRDWSDELGKMETIIVSAVAWAVKSGGK
jgi:hypothetical protein